MIAQRPQLSLTFGPDRALVWERGQSVRYLVADISATGTILQDPTRVPVNLALAIDVSGSMGGEKLDAAKATAAAVAEALTADDRLTIVAFGNEAMLMLEARRMDARGRKAAAAAIARLDVQGCTNLFGGWDLATGRVAAARHEDSRASHRVLILTDGLANVGISDAPSLARFAGDAQRDGIITSAVGIGDDYDEALLAAMVEAGGGRLHDATSGQEIHEVVLGELLEGRQALVERAVLAVTLPAEVTRVEIVGPWGSTARGPAIHVLVGSLQPEQQRRVILRVFCGAGAVGSAFEVNAMLTAQLPDGSAELRVDAPPVTLTFADGDVNRAQARDADRSHAALAAWQGVAMRDALQLNRAGQGREARQYLGRELERIKRYARGLRGTRALLRELELLHQQVEEQMDGRVVKELYMMRMKSGRGERDLRTREALGAEELLQQPRPRRPRA